MFDGKFQFPLLAISDIMDSICSNSLKRPNSVWKLDDGEKIFFSENGL